MPAAGRPLLVLVVALAAARSWLVPAVAAGGPAGTKICKTECPKYSKQLPLKILKSYELSTCRTKTSVILKTNGNRTRCANPEETWVMDAMKAIDSWNAVTKDPPGAGRHSGEALVTSQHTALPHPKDASTRSSSDGSKANTVTLENMNDAGNKGDLTGTPSSIETSTLGSTSSKTLDPTTISDFPQNNLKESTPGTIANTSDVPSKLQDHTIPQIMIPLCGFLSFALAVGGLMYAKRVICTRPPAMRGVQNLVYSPCESQAETFPLDKV